MIKLRIQSVLLALLVFSTAIYAQSVVPPNAVDVLLAVVEDENATAQDDVPIDLESLFSAAAEGEFNATIVVTLEGPEDIAELLVEFKNADGTVLFNDVLEFDGPAVQEGNINYLREGNVVYLGIGEYDTIASNYEASVKIRDVYGEESVATTYSTTN